MINCNSDLLLGLDERVIVGVPEFECRVHQQVIEPLSSLVESARAAGFTMKIASSYRSFARQLMIWNNKAMGLRPVLNDVGQTIDMSTLSARDKVFAILRWSALPGASRHHWGTEVDVYGYRNLKCDDAVQLTIAETEGNGPYAEFHQWLSDELASKQTVFFRPYASDHGGIAPEPWHLSYAPLAKEFARELTENLLCEQIKRTELELKTPVLDNLDEIYWRFVHVK